jgi:hypothetical protein
MNTLRKITIRILAAVAVLAILPFPNASAGVPKIGPAVVNLSGRWSCDDGGTYYLKQSAGSQLFWFGESGDAGKSWSNIFHADLKQTGSKDGVVRVGSVIGGAWTDVPKGEAKNSGLLFLKIQSIDSFVIGKEGLGRDTFGGTTFTRIK